MQVQNRVAIESDVFGPRNQQINCGLVVQDHLCLAGIVAFGRFAELDQPLRVQQRIGIAFETARVPGEIDQQPFVDLPRIGSGGVLAVGRVPEVEEMSPSFRREIPRHAGPVIVEKPPTIADRGTCLDGGTDGPADRCPGSGERNVVVGGKRSPGSRQSA